MNSNVELQSVFHEAFNRLKKSYEVRYRFSQIDEISPNERALRNAISKLPCAVKCIELKIDPSIYKNVKDEACYLIKYDFTKFGDNPVEFMGQFDVENRVSLVQVLQEKFGLNKNESERVSDLPKEFNMVGISFDDFSRSYIQLTPFDILKRPDEFANSLSVIFLILEDTLIKLFKNENEIDFKTLYGLKRDNILPFLEVVAKDKIFEHFVKYKDGKPSKLTLEDLQSHVADIQLIPTVPESVRRVFSCAKYLYIFGYFRYCFFTVSNHYVYLALESAIKNKYNEWLGGRAILTNKKEESIEIDPPTYRKIQEFGFKKKKNWSCEQIRVNGDKFPCSMNELLDWLVNKEIITKLDKNMFEFGISYRDSLSHLEVAPILHPSARALEVVAQDINKLYHKQSKPSA
ncbi:MAG: hypothetical protein O8C66_06395 [Candidatus Methanoperedens sp.]|nr:hypothetical protein [Candidatus Methanoperedens sp.]MCZ7370120.1 hypothetical protein [Candidatus Methanoperedens sp.]